MKWNVILTLTLFLSACSTGADLYPVKGPLSRKIPLPVIHAKVHNIVANSGPIELTMPDGEHCSGKWSVVAPRMSGSANFNSMGTVSSGLDTAFVQIHGTTFYNAARPGVNKGSAIITGDKGRLIEIAFLVGSGTANGYGVATDNRGNTYKVLF